MEKEIRYAALIQDQIGRMFQDESENHIDPNELSDDENAKAFFHALANLVPCDIWNKLTGKEDNLLEFNHVANHLVFDFTKIGK